MFDEIPCDSYAAATVYLGRARGIQNVEQRHCTFLNLVMCVNFARLSDFFVNGGQG